MKICTITLSSLLHNFICFVYDFLIFLISHQNIRFSSESDNACISLSRSHSDISSHFPHSGRVSQLYGNENVLNGKGKTLLKKDNNYSTTFFVAISLIFPKQNLQHSRKCFMFFHVQCCCVLCDDVSEFVFLFCCFQAILTVYGCVCV